MEKDDSEKSKENLYDKYDNPSLAEQIYTTYQNDRVIPKKILEEVLRTCSTASDLKSRLRNLDRHYGSRLIIREAYEIKGHRSSSGIDIDAIGSWSLGVRTIEDSDK